MKNNFIFWFISFSALSIFAAKPQPPKFLVIQPIKTITVKAGKSVETTLSISIAPEFHIQANPVGQANLIPTTIEFSEKDGLSLVSVIYPEGKVFRLENSEKDLQVYGGEVTFKLKLQAKTAQPGKQDFIGVLRFQPCNSKICFFPTRYEIKIPVQVLK